MTTDLEKIIETLARKLVGAHPDQQGQYIKNAIQAAYEVGKKETTMTSIPPKTKQELFEYAHQIGFEQKNQEMINATTNFNML